MKSFLKLCLTFGSLLMAGGCGSRPAVQIWNLPPLITKSAVDLQKSIGAPATVKDIDPNTQQGAWSKDASQLIVTWKKRSGRITELELTSRNASNALRDGNTADLLVPGGLKENDPGYQTEWIEAPDHPLFYTGVKVVPAPRTHTLLVRASGDQSLLNVAYQVTGAGGKSDTMLTVAPWEASFVVLDDATVSASAGLFKRLERMTIEVKIEILIDGKVVSSDAATDRSVSCDYQL